MSTILYGVVSSYQFISDKVPDICALFFNKLQCICCNLSASYFQAYCTEDQDRNVGVARKVSPDWSHKTMTCHSSNCFSIFWGSEKRTTGDFSSEQLLHDSPREFGV